MFDTTAGVGAVGSGPPCPTITGGVGGAVKPMTSGTGGTAPHRSEIQGPGPLETGIYVLSSPEWWADAKVVRTPHATAEEALAELRAQFVGESLPDEPYADSSSEVLAILTVSAVLPVSGETLDEWCAERDELADRKKREAQDARERAEYERLEEKYGEHREKGDRG